MKDAEKTIGNIIDKSGGAYISYIDKMGFPVTRAMLPPRERNGIKEFYFTTNTSSDKVSYFKTNNKGSIYFVDKRFLRGVSLVGTVEVLCDEKTKLRIWRDGDEKFYPLGTTDPDYCVLKFTITNGRYYANYKNESFEVK